jgi:cobalt-precorrin-5B (C1)-methyltransferase
LAALKGGAFSPIVEANMFIKNSFNSPMARTGYTLPVFAVAAAKAALMHLREKIDSQPTVEIDLLPEKAEIPISQVAALDAQSALAVTLSDPGDNLDLTRNTPIWAWVRLSERESQALILEAGEGLGKTALEKQQFTTMPVACLMLIYYL